MDLFSQITSDRTGGNGRKLGRGGKGVSGCVLDQTLGRISSDIRKDFFIERMIKYWNGFPRQVPQH